MSRNTVQAGDFLRDAREQLGRFERALAELRDARREHDERVRELELARGRALDELVETSLPALTREAIDRAGKDVHYGRFATDDPLARIEAAKLALGEKIRAIEGDERYARRDALLDPVTGELTLELAKLEHDLGQLRGPLERYDREPRFRELLACGYDTEYYKGSPWRLQYYRDWKWGDVYCEQFGHERFAQVREAYFNLRTAHDAVQRDVDAVRRKIDDVNGLVGELAESRRRLGNVEADALAAARVLLREHLEHIDRRQLARWLGADENRVALVKRLHGIEHKRDYLQEMAAKQFGTEAETIDRATGKLRRKIAKFSRPKNANARIPAAEASAWLADPTTKLAARRERFREGYDTVYAFDRYDAFDFARDMLWWDVMTDGELDGDFIPEVRAYRDGRPDAARNDNLTRASTAYTNPAPDRDLDEVS